MNENLLNFLALIIGPEESLNEKTMVSRAPIIKQMLNQCNHDELKNPLIQVKYFDNACENTEQQNYVDTQITSFRVFSEQEQNKISLSSRRYLIRLYYSGLLNIFTLEHIIDSLMAIKTPQVSLKKTKWLTEMLLKMLNSSPSSLSKITWQ